jgi:hypothetical protein
MFLFVMVCQSVGVFLSSVRWVCWDVVAPVLGLASTRLLLGCVSLALRRLGVSSLACPALRRLGLSSLACPALRRLGGCPRHHTAFAALVILEADFSTSTQRRAARRDEAKKSTERIK